MIFIIAQPLAYYVKYVLLETTHHLTVHEEAPRQEAAFHFGPENFRHCTTLMERKTNLDTLKITALYV